MSESVLRGRKIVGGKAEGYALVSKDRICFLATVDTDGTVIEKGHALYGQNIAGKILIFPSGRGSTSGSYRLYEMALNGTAPAAIVVEKADAVLVSAVVLAGIPTIHQLEKEPYTAITTGDYVAVNADEGSLQLK